MNTHVRGLSVSHLYFDDRTVSDRKDSTVRLRINSRPEGSDFLYVRPSQFLLKKVVFSNI